MAVDTSSIPVGATEALGGVVTMTVSGLPSVVVTLEAAVVVLGPEMEVGVRVNDIALVKLL